MRSWFPPQQKWSTWQQIIPCNSPLTFQKNNASSHLQIAHPVAISSSLTFTYHFLGASVSRQTVLLSFHNITLPASFGGFVKTFLFICFPCRKVALMSIELTYHFIETAMAKIPVYFLYHTLASLYKGCSGLLLQTHRQLVLLSLFYCK